MEIFAHLVVFTYAPRWSLFYLSNSSSIFSFHDVLVGALVYSSILVYTILGGPRGACPLGPEAHCSGGRTRSAVGGSAGAWRANVVAHFCCISLNVLLEFSLIASTPDFY